MNANFPNCPTVLPVMNRNQKEKKGRKVKNIKYKSTQRGTKDEERIQKLKAH